MTPPNVAQTWMSGQAPPLLSLQLGRVCVRYTISEESRTLTVHHVIGQDDDGGADIIPDRQYVLVVPVSGQRPGDRDAK
jgi:hypothetical protein